MTNNVSEQSDHANNWNM